MDTLLIHKSYVIFITKTKKSLSLLTKSKALTSLGDRKKI